MSRIFMRSVKELGHQSKTNTSPTDKPTETNEHSTETCQVKGDGKRFGKTSRRIHGRNRQKHVDHHSKVSETPHRPGSEISGEISNNSDSKISKVDNKIEPKTDKAKEKIPGEDWSLETFDHCQDKTVKSLVLLNEREATKDTVSSPVSQNERDQTRDTDADLNNNDSSSKGIESLDKNDSNKNITTDLHENHLADTIALSTGVDDANTNNSALTAGNKCSSDRMENKPICDNKDSSEGLTIDTKSLTENQHVKHPMIKEGECLQMNSSHRIGFRGKASRSWSSLENLNKHSNDSTAKPMWNNHSDSSDSRYNNRYGHTNPGYKYGHNNWKLPSGNAHSNSGFASVNAHYNHRYSSGNMDYNSKFSSGNSYYNQRNSSGNTDYNCGNSSGNFHNSSRPSSSNAHCNLGSSSGNTYNNHAGHPSQRTNESHSPSKNYKFSRNNESSIPPRFRPRSDPVYQHGRNDGGRGEKSFSTHGFNQPNLRGQNSSLASGNDHRHGNYSHNSVNYYNRNSTSNLNYNGGNNYKNDRNERIHTFNRPVMSLPNREQNYESNNWNTENNDLHESIKNDQRIPVSEDWLSEIEEVEINIEPIKTETNCMSNDEVNEKADASISCDKNEADHVGVSSMMEIETISDSLENMNEVSSDFISSENKDKLDDDSVVTEDKDIVRNADAKIGNNDIGFETKDIITISDVVVQSKLGPECGKTLEQVDNLDGKLENVAEKLIVVEKVPYLPPIPDEILQEYDRFEEVVDHSDFDIKFADNGLEVSEETVVDVVEEIGKADNIFVGNDDEINMNDIEYAIGDNDTPKEVSMVDIKCVSVENDLEHISMNKESATVVNSNGTDIANKEIVSLNNGLKSENIEESDKSMWELGDQSMDFTGEEKFPVAKVSNIQVKECSNENIPLIQIEECSNKNIPMDSNVNEIKAKHTQLTPFLHEDSSSVSSLVMKSKGPCAFSAFDSASEADVSDICFDDRKIFEALESQSSDGELKQGMTNFESKYQASIPVDQQFCSTRYGEYGEYSNSQLLPNEAYTKDSGKTQPMSEYYPYEYNWWYQDVWYQQMRYHWDLYHRSYCKSFSSVDNDPIRTYDASSHQQTGKNTHQARTARPINYNHSSMITDCKSDNIDEGRITCSLGRNETSNRMDPLEERSENSNFEKPEKGNSDDLSHKSKNKLSKYWSKRMERWVQKQYAHAKYFQDVDTKPVSDRQNIDNNENRNSTTDVEIDPLQSISSKLEADHIEAKRSSAENDRSPSNVEEPTDNSDVKSVSTDCICKKSDVQFIVWRACKCPAGNPPKVHQVLPCKHDDGNLDMGYLSYESLESVKKEENRTINKPPGFLIGPMNAHSSNKERVEQQSELQRKSYEDSLDRVKYPDLTRPPPGFVTSKEGPPKTEMEDTDEDMSNSEINNNITSKIYQPLTLKQIIQQHNSSQSSGSYSPSESDMLNCGENYSDMPECMAESASHLEEAVEKMEKAEIIEKKLFNALYVVNKRISDIQKDISKKRTLSDIINSDTYGQTENKDIEKVEENARQVSVQQNTDKNGNIKQVHGAGDLHQCVSTSSLYQQKDEQKRYHSNKNANVSDQQKTSLSCQGSGDNKLNYSPEDGSPFEIPENEMMDSSNSGRVNMTSKHIVCDNEPGGMSYRPLCQLPNVPPTCRPLVNPPPFMPPPMGYYDTNWTAPPPYPPAYYDRVVYDPRFGYRPRYPIDLPNKHEEQNSTYNQSPLGPLPFRPLLSPMKEETVDCNRKRKEMKEIKMMKDLRTPTTPSVDTGLKLIESYDTSDDDDNDDSPEIRPFDVDSIGSASDFATQPVNDIRRPTPKKFKKTENWSAMSPEKAVEKMEVSIPRRPIRGMRLKQKTLKSFNSAEALVHKKSPSVSHAVTDESRQGKRKKSMAEMIAESTNNSGEQLGCKSLNDFNTINSEEGKNLPDFPPLPPFPNSPFWCMYQPDNVSALCGKSPELDTKRSSYESKQLLRRSFDGATKRYSLSPGFGLYSPSESDSEKTTWRKDWKKNFKLFHDFGVKYIDTHCHLDFLFNRENFKGTFPAYMEKHSETFPELFEGCVAVFCNPSTFTPNGGLWLEVAKEPNVWIAMGCHPKMANDFTAASEYGLKKCLQHKKCIALGEIGLDYSGTFRQHEETQKQVFRCQLKMAIRYGKPIVIHSRDAEDDCIEILKEIVPRNWKIHCHCFTNAYKNATKWMDEFPNLFIGVTPLVTYRSATPTHDLARKIPLNKLLLETDAPYFIPSCIPKDDFPLSNPGVAVTVAKEIAQYQEVPVAQVLRQCRLNTRAMYGI
ncbi:putative deoxyribonuclease tatdn2 [Mactra antiquata]